MMDIMLGVLGMGAMGAMFYIVSKWLNEKW
jgi:hypothetical protein